LENGETEEKEEGGETEEKEEGGGRRCSVTLGSDDRQIPERKKEGG